MLPLATPRRVVDCSFSPSTRNLQRPSEAARRARNGHSSLAHSFDHCSRRERHGPAQATHTKNLFHNNGSPPSRVKRKSGTRRMPSIARLHTSFSGILFMLFLLFMLCDVASGARVEEAVAKSKQRSRSTRGTLTTNGEVLVDRSELLTVRMPIERRNGASVPSFSISTATSTSESSAGQQSKTTAVVPTRTSSSKSSSLATATNVPTNTALPQPFDASLGNNFTTTTCPDFFNSFLANSTFQGCVPFSLLLQTSQGFFQASKSLVLITQILDASCSVSFNTCDDLMADLAVQLKRPENCGQDFGENNPIVFQAYDGFISYQTMFQAGCQKDPRGTYCFADAITNATSVADSYPYYLPLNIGLPGGARPTCNTCLQDTMSSFANAASNSSLPISRTYRAAAEQIDIGCGPNFVNTTVPVSTGGASSIGYVGSAPLLTLLVVLVHVIF